MKILISVISIFFINACSQGYNLIPCNEANYKKNYSKISITKNAKILLETENTQKITLSSKSQTFELIKNFNSFTSNEKLSPNKYKITPKIKNVKKLIYLWDDDELEAENTIEKKLAPIYYGETLNSVSKCMCDTDDWFKVQSKSKCLKPIVRASVVSRFENEINFEIFESGQSFGLLSLNNPYLLDIKKENILHVFAKEGDGLYKYYINIIEICYPKIEKFKVISFVSKAYNTPVLIDGGNNFGIIKNMKFYFVDNVDRSLKICIVSDVSSNKAVCTFEGQKIQELPENVFFME